MILQKLDYEKQLKKLELFEAVFKSIFPEVTWEIERKYLYPSDLYCFYANNFTRSEKETKEILKANNLIDLFSFNIKICSFYLTIEKLTEKTKTERLNDFLIFLRKNQGNKIKIANSTKEYSGILKSFKIEDNLLKIKLAKTLIEKNTEELVIVIDFINYYE